MTTMHLKFQNAETINRLVEQGEFLLKRFHDEHEKEPTGVETEFVRGELTGWRSTLHTLYRDYAEDIVDRVVTRTRLTIPDAKAQAVLLIPIEAVEARAGLEWKHAEKACTTWMNRNLER